MKLRLPKKALLSVSLILVIAVIVLVIYPRQIVDFNTQVKPILNKKCIACHGGVKQQGGFSVLFREEALQKTESGKYAIVPGKPGQSEMIKRITEKDPEERMPYKHEPLSGKEITILRNWIKQGAQWGKHWAYSPVEEQVIPVEKNDWIKNDIDRFVYRKLKEKKLQPSVLAGKAILLRRLSLDITGLPADSGIATTFLQDNSEIAYEKLTDALLASPSYGEKWTSLWMDLARYSDTKGYESDQPRKIWKYRDWLIKSFNNDKPYNDFLIEQIAGDLMPGADDDKYIATAFHRNSLNNDEGGTENEEFRTAAVMDRVNTTWTALMGTTFNCVQCHSHPYDPFKHEEYYKFMAYFNNTRDEDLPAEYPLLRHYAKDDSSKFLQVKDWLQTTANAATANWYISFLKTLQPAVNSHLCDNYTKGVLYQNNHASLDIGGSCRLPAITTTGKANMLLRYLNNKGNATLSIYSDSLKGQLLAKVPLVDTKSKWKVDMINLPPIAGIHDLWFRFETTVEKDKLPLLFDWFAFAPAFPGRAGKQYIAARNNFIELVMAEPATTPVMVENTDEQKRVTYIFDRGSWLSKGDEVKPDVPHIMNPLPVNAPANRLGLALWLTDKKNPLTARTMVNRIWEQLFGTGLAETLEDLGTQGIPPVHKELLDYLSWKFMHQYNWSIKKLLKEIVMSATYRQSSATTNELVQKDPNNILLARMTRIRLTGEQMRDQALAVSHLLSKKMYGESVMPYQPERIWASPYNPFQWKLSKGEDQYRRAVYTYWKRTAPYPSMINFDGGSREVCVARRIRTNTPLQALNSLNDSAYLVPARQFAINMRKADPSVKKQIETGYQKMFYQSIAPAKLKILVDLYEQAVVQYKKDKTAANAMMGDKNKPALPEDAAMAVVANAMMNLDEWVNKN
jgi:Protein of unknown function (DUF1553)/Protein of unknown function (DUF1549)/Planctomycete cytochrome C